MKTKAFQITTCPTCDFLYAPDDNGDNQQHKHRHNLYLKATDRLQYTPLSFADQEIAKNSAWQQYRQAEAIEDKAKYLVQVIRCHYDRDFHAAIANNSYLRLPTFERYVVENLDQYKTVDREVKDYLARQYVAIAETPDNAFVS